MSNQSGTAVREKPARHGALVAKARPAVFRQDKPDSLDKSSFRQTLWKVACGAILIIGLIPLFFICWLIFSTGANNICVDYAAFLHVVDKVLSGQYQWGSLLSDSFIRTHMVLLPVLVHTAIAYLTHWDVVTELYVGMAFHVARAALLADLVSHRVADRWARLAISGGVFALVFAMSQTCIMIYGEASIAIGLCLLGFTFAVWSLCKYGRTPRGLALMVLGGTASSYSFGNVVPCWATLLIAIFLLPARGWNQHWEAAGKSFRPGILDIFVNKRAAFAYWLFGAAISLSPYLYFLGQRGAKSPELTRTFSWFDPIYIVNALGRPLARDMGLNYGRLPGAELSGAIILSVLIALVIPAVVFRVRLSSVGRISILLFSYGFLSVWTIGIFRTHVAPWYASMSMYCWIAALGVCSASLYREFRSPRSVFGAVLASVSGVSLIAIIALYLQTNLSYGDKQFFLNARAPVSAEYLRAYRTAPTFLESTVFSNDGRPDRILSFAGALDRHGLCVFAPNQTWSLQGQFALDNVSIERLPGSKRVMWLAGKSLRGAKSWRDYHHLNLLVPEGNVVEWRITVPKGAFEAVFRTAVSEFKDPAGLCAMKTEKVVSAVSVFCDSPYSVRQGGERHSATASGGASYVTFCDNTWKPLQLNLLPYRGKTVTIRLRSYAQGDVFSGLCEDKNCLPSAILYAYPHVSIVEEARPNLAPKSDLSVTEAQTPFVPSNTDLSAQFPRHYTQRFDLPSLESRVWEPSNVGLEADTSQSIAGRYWSIGDKERRLSIDDYDYLTMQLQPMPGKEWCSLKMHLQFDDGTTDGYSIPLLADRESHSYAYPVKLLTPRSGARLAGVLVFASAIDSKPLPAHRNAVIRSESRSDAITPGFPLCGCVKVSNLAFIKSVGK